MVNCLVATNDVCDTEQEHVCKNGDDCSLKVLKNFFNSSKETLDKLEHAMEVCESKLQRLEGLA